MNITIPLIVPTVAYTSGAITKIFIKKLPNRYIPIQNVIIGIISAIICVSSNLENNFLNALVLCIISTMGAGGLSDLASKNKKTT